MVLHVDVFWYFTPLEAWLDLVWCGSDGWHFVMFLSLPSLAPSFYLHLFFCILVSHLAMNSSVPPLKLFVMWTLILWISVNVSTVPFLCNVSFALATCSHRLSIFFCFCFLCLSLQGVPSCRVPHAALVLFMTQWCWSTSVLVVTQVHTQSILADCKVYGHAFKKLVWPTFVRYRACSKKEIIKVEDTLNWDWVVISLSLLRLFASKK